MPDPTGERTPERVPCEHCGRLVKEADLMAALPDDFGPTRGKLLCKTCYYDRYDGEPIDPFSGHWRWEQDHPDEVLDNMQHHARQTRNR
jgi:hypothetical protein